jgi:PKD repeat protein
VTDDTDLPNNSAAGTILVEVNHAPVPVIDAPAVACPGEGLKFSAAGSSDADGTIAGYAWIFGDPDTAEGVETTHRYQAPGFYDLGLEVDDGRGLNNSHQQTTQRFHVNRPPRAEAGPDRMACPGQPITFDASTSSDWDGKLENHTWDFGDGALAEGVAVEHVFDEPGVYGVRLRVTDDSGSACAAASDVVRVVVNGPPVAEAGGDQKGFVGGAHDQLLFDASSSRDDDGQPLSFLWDFGDGVTVAGEKVLHAYDEPGVYPVRLSVSDGSGLACGQAADGATVAVQQRK